MKDSAKPSSGDTLYEKVNSLPSLAPVVQKISAVMSDPEVSAEDIVNVLKLDPAIAGKVLRLANSAYIGIPRTVSSLQNAVVILGHRRIHSLVLAASTLSSFSFDNHLPFDGISFWKHSLIVALICESIARHIKRYDTIDAGEVFCAGLLHDIGKLVLGQYDSERISASYKDALEQKVPFYSCEDEKNSHIQIGAFVAEKWHFPESLVTAIRYHHTPGYAEKYNRMVAITHVADIMVHLIGFSTVTGEATPPMDEGVMDEIGLSPERLKVIADNAIKSEKQFESLVDIFS